MTGAAKNTILEDTLSRYLVELQEDAARADTLRRRANSFQGSTNRYKVESKNICMSEIPLLENPRSRGKVLTSNLSGLWRCRVGDYRILCRIPRR